MEPGIDLTVLEHLITKIDHLTEEERVCALLFDRMALKKRCDIKSTKDETKISETKEQSNYDNILVFMLQGIYKKIKQPIALYFLKGTLPPENMATLIKTIINIIISIGYKIITIICDHSPTNVSAINLLKHKTDHIDYQNYFLFKDEKIFIVYDVPHLYKSICKNFIQAGEMMLSDKKAEWRHLIQVEEKNRSKNLGLTKITKKHFARKNKAKMSVRTVAQILSNTMAENIRLVSLSVEDEKESSAMLQTAEVIEALDHLFDCSNGPISKEEIKTFRTNVTTHSLHHDLWPKYQDMLRTLIFLKSDSQLRLRNSRCVNCYIITLWSFEDIWDYVITRNFYFLNLRLLNLDSLQKFFGVMRQYMRTKKKPLRYCFKGALISPLLNQLTPEKFKN